MAVTHGTPTRNAICSAVAAAVGSGGKLKIRDLSNVVLATIAMNATPFAAPSGGAMALNGLPIGDTVPDAGGTAANFICTDSSDVTVFGGSVGTSGADLNLSSLTFVVSPATPVSITSGSYTAPA